MRSPGRSWPTQPSPVSSDPANSYPIQTALPLLDGLRCSHVGFMLCHHRPIHIPSQGRVETSEQTRTVLYCCALVPINIGGFTSQDPFVNKNRHLEVAIPFSRKRSTACLENFVSLHRSFVYKVFTCDSIKRIQFSSI
jgi:hypothetical protein